MQRNRLIAIVFFTELWFYRQRLGNRLRQRWLRGFGGRNRITIDSSCYRSKPQD